MNGDIIKQKNKDPLNINRFRYGAYGRIGIGTFNLFFYYGFSELFESGKGPEGTKATTITIGVSITGF